MADASPAEQLRAFIAKFAPEDQRLIRACRTAMRKRLPTANELVYDNYNFFVIGYGPTERPSDAPFSLACQAGSVALCFLYGAKLADPGRVLKGSGNPVRSLRLPTARRLTDPEVEALIAQAVSRSKAPFQREGGGKLVIRSVSAKQRPRRKAK